MTTEQQDDTLVFFTINDVAEMFQVTPETVRTWVNDGHLPAMKLPGSRMWRINKIDALEFARQRFSPGGAANQQQTELI